MPLLLVACLVLSGACTGEDAGETPTGSAGAETERPSVTPDGSGAWTTPGLVGADGEPVDVPEPPAPTGESIDVTTVGADPAAGTGDDARAIREALARARPGDAVHLPAGTYDLESADPDDPTAHLTLPSGVTLRGDGMDETVLRSSFDAEDDAAVLRGRAVEDVTVADLTVTSTYDGELGTDTEDDAGGGGPMFGLLIGERDGLGSARVLVEGVRVERFQRHGISVKASREVTVRACEVGDATSVGPGGAGYGIAIEGRADQRDPDASNDSRHHVVVDNVLHGAHLRHAILLQFPTHHNLVADNVIRRSRLDAIDLHGEGEYGNEIRDNVVVDGERAGIALGNSGGSTHRHGASGEGNWVHDNLLVGNQVGVLVILGTPGTVVERNRVVADPDSEAGVVLDHAPGTTVRDNTMSAPWAGFVAVEDRDS